MTREVDAKALAASARRLVAFNQLDPTYGIKFTRVWLDQLIRRGLFPAPVKVSEHRIAWRASEIEEWIATRPTAR